MIIASQTEKLGFTRSTVPRTERLVKVNWQIAGDNLFVDVDPPKGLPWVVERKGRLVSYK